MGGVNQLFLILFFFWWELVLFLGLCLFTLSGQQPANMAFVARVAFRGAFGIPSPIIYNIPDVFCARTSFYPYRVRYAVYI